MGKKGRSRHFLVVALLLAPATVGAVPPDAGTPAGVGTDLAQVERCLACHGALRAAWERPHSHSLLMDCGTCHALKAASGKGHADSAPCAKCHSQATHPAGAACGTCHATHGSANAFLVRESVDLPGGGTAAVHVTKPEGASKDGLVRAEVDGQVAGTGLCEVCHRQTAYFAADGKSPHHKPEWCGRCHAHVDGFGEVPLVPR